MAGKTTYDFDNWSDEDEEKAILAAVPEVKHVIVERKFVGRLTDGTIVEVPLRLTLGDVNELQAEYSTPLDQFEALLKKVYGATAPDLSGVDMVEGAILAEQYFRTLQRVQQAAFPES